MLFADSVFLFLLFFLFLLHRSRGRYDLEQRRHLRAVTVGDLYIRLIPQTLKVIFARLWLTLLSHRAARFVFIEGRGIASGRARIDSQNLIALVGF